MPPSEIPDPSPQETSRQVAKTFFGVGSDPASRKSAIRGLLVGAVECAVLIPLLFYWRFGEVGGLGWGVTVFFVAYCLLAAIGLYFQARPEFHTPVLLRGDWADRVGAFWLVSCAFGPFLGWVVTSVFPITESTWRWLYALRALLAIGAPIVTALPLTRYLRGKATWVALPLLVIVTLLPILSAANVARDLWAGAAVRPAETAGQVELYLQYTKISLGLLK
jgi:hypothetical protein